VDGNPSADRAGRRDADGVVDNGGADGGFHGSAEHPGGSGRRRRDAHDPRTGDSTGSTGSRGANGPASTSTPDTAGGTTNATSGTTGTSRRAARSADPTTRGSRSWSRSTG